MTSKERYSEFSFIDNTKHKEIMEKRKVYMQKLFNKIKEVNEAQNDNMNEMVNEHHVVEQTTNELVNKDDERILIKNDSVEEAKYNKDTVLETDDSITNKAQDEKYNTEKKRVFDKLKIKENIMLQPTPEKVVDDTSQATAIPDSYRVLFGGDKR